MKAKEGTVVVTLAVPRCVWEYFEECAKQALDSECYDINKTTLARKRSEIMINELKDSYKKKSKVS